MRWSAQGPCGVSLNALPLAASAGRGLVVPFQPQARFGAEMAPRYEGVPTKNGPEKLFFMTIMKNQNFGALEI